MNNYEDWAQLVAKNLEHESNFIASIDKDELDDKAASEAFVRAVLEPFLPENYGIGAGRVVRMAAGWPDHGALSEIQIEFLDLTLKCSHA